MAHHRALTGADLHELLPEADIVIVLLPLTPETRHIVDAGFLARMKRGALLVNAGRCCMKLLCAPPRTLLVHERMFLRCQGMTSLPSCHALF